MLAVNSNYIQRDKKDVRALADIARAERMHLHFLVDKTKRGIRLIALDAFSNLLSDRLTGNFALMFCRQQP